MWSKDLLTRTAYVRSVGKATEALQKRQVSPDDPWIEAFPLPGFAFEYPPFEDSVQFEWPPRIAAALAATAAAVERHRIEHGGWPDTLDALVPGYMDHVPMDVYSGEPVKYRTGEDGGCVIYSVGKNRTDDGGEKGPGRYTTKDIVFHLFSEAQRAAAREIVPVAEDAEGGQHDDR